MATLSKSITPMQTENIPENSLESPNETCLPPEKRQWIIDELNRININQFKYKYIDMQ